MEDEQEGHEMQAKAEVGVFGGSGFYSFLEDVEEVPVDTPYGQPSDSYFIGDIGGTKVAFLPRHGRRHQLPPHMINYRANVWGMKELGVKRIIGPCASGSLNREMGIGHFVVCDQFVDRTWGRRDTFYDGPTTTHVSAADPYCLDLRQALVTAGRELGITVHERGTVVVIQGPRFSTRAESKWFSAMGWDVINMTGYPEGYLARELELCYANISLVTDFDAGLADDPAVPPVSHHEVVSAFNASNERLRELLFAVIPRLAKAPGCDCGSALAGARG
jgi:5'-methylthioadenosine phosphorylase